MRIILSPQNIYYKPTNGWIKKVISILPLGIDRKLYFSVNRAFIRFYSIPIDIEISCDKKQLQTIIKECELALKELEKNENE
jgi:hypothetical protein